MQNSSLIADECRPTPDSQDAVSPVSGCLSVVVCEQADSNRIAMIMSVFMVCSLQSLWLVVVDFCTILRTARFIAVPDLVFVVESHLKPPSRLLGMEDNR